MRLRTFIAKDLKEALRAMRAELGDEAVIIANEKLKDGTVLLRAGLEDAQEPAQPAREVAGDSSSNAGVALFPLASCDARYHERLVARLRGATPGGASPALAFDGALLSRILRAHRTPDALVHALADAAEKIGLPDLTLALASALDKFMRSDPLDANQVRPIILVGPPGAGKTTVAAKLAAQYCLSGRSVRLAATDLASAGQLARLESFGACLNVPVVRAPTPEILQGAVEEAHGTNAVLIADSCGCDPRGSLPPELLGFLAIGRLDIVGVVSAAIDAEEAGEIAAALGKLGATKLIVTGLDLSRRSGALIAFGLSGLSIAQVTASPYLAEGLEMLTPLALSRRILAAASSLEE